MPRFRDFLRNTKSLGNESASNKLTYENPCTFDIETVAGVGNIQQCRRNTRVELLKTLGRHFRTKLGRLAFETGEVSPRLPTGLRFRML